MGSKCTVLRARPMTCKKCPHKELIKLIGFIYCLSFSHKNYRVWNQISAVELIGGNFANP